MKFFINVIALGRIEIDREGVRRERGMHTKPGCIYFAEFVFAKLELGIFLHYERRLQIDLIWFDFEVDKPALPACITNQTRFPFSLHLSFLLYLGQERQGGEFVTSAAFEQLYYT